MAITTGERTGSTTHGTIELAGFAGLASIAFGIVGAVVDEMTMMRADRSAAPIGG